MADKSSKTTKRRIKDPESFRERALKAAESTEQPTRVTKLKRGGGKVLRPVSKVTTLSQRQPFKFITKVLRLIGKIIFPPYVRNSWRELRLVTWPTWKQSRQLTFAVLVFAVIFGAAIATVDWGLDKVFKQLLLK